MADPNNARSFHPLLHKASPTRTSKTKVARQASMLRPPCFSPNMQRLPPRLDKLPPTSQSLSYLLSQSTSSVSRTSCTSHFLIQCVTVHSARMYYELLSTIYHGTLPQQGQRRTNVILSEAKDGARSVLSCVHPPQHLDSPSKVFPRKERIPLARSID